VPVPEESESVTEAVLNALFLRGARPARISFNLISASKPLRCLLHAAGSGTPTERINRYPIRQRALKPDEVRKELEAADAVLATLRRCGNSC